MKFASFLTLAILGISIGCGTTIETRTMDATASNRASTDQTGGTAKKALDNALATAKADSKKLLVHFGSPG